MLAAGLQIMNEYQKFREQIDEFMQHHPQSPLDEAHRLYFRGLFYYEPSPAYLVMATVTRFSAREPLVEMETSTGDRRRYRRWGRAHFTIDGEAAALTIYANPYEEDFFLPFRDATSGKETYSAGRYLDSHRPGLRQLGEGEIGIDFNWCYNPYCAYNEGYSCPLPPRENWLAIPIRAGEKVFHSSSR